MGVTIHFEGQLKSRAELFQLRALAHSWAETEGWSFSDITREHRELQRVKAETDWNYSGFTEGIELQPHKDADPLRMEFDEDLYIQEYIKTQFAGPEVHIQIISFLKDIQPFFNELFVNDEGEFWESGNKQQLLDHMEACNRTLNDLLKENPKASGPIRLPSGRIVDCFE